MSTLYLILIAASIFIFGFFLGWLFRKIICERKIDGILVIERVEDRDVFRWVFNQELEDFKSKKQLYIKVKRSKN